MSKPRILPTVILLTPFVFSFAFAMDIYIPAVPKMKEALHTSQANIQLTLSLFMLISGVGQLFVGPITDQHGRRRLALFSILAYILGSALCAAAYSIEMLIWARVIQALGGCGMLVVAFAAVRDQFSGKEAAKVYSFLNCGLGMSPLFAPIIGSYLYNWYGWRSGFVFLTALAVAIGIMAFCQIKETLPTEKRVKMDAHIFRRYCQILKNPTFIVYALCASAALSMFFVFFSSSPYIIINLLHVPVKNFGFYFLFVSSMFFIGSLICGKLVEKAGVLRMAFIGICLVIAAGVIMTLWYKWSGLSSLQYVLPCMIAGIGGSFMMGVGVAGAMEPFAESAGSAAAMVGCLEFLCSSIIGSAVMHWPINSTLPVSLTMIVTGVISLAAMVFYVISRIKRA